ncbi:hypothetical protein HDU98_006118 [Podochytrium sp. JEL0797]|nr:hypothetical protein HDU98_006118 [Podochytrium sp. JEL0797]
MPPLSNKRKAHRARAIAANAAKRARAHGTTHIDPAPPVAAAAESNIDSSPPPPPKTRYVPADLDSDSDPDDPENATDWKTIEIREWVEPKSVTDLKWTVQAEKVVAESRRYVDSDRTRRRLKRQDTVTQKAASGSKPLSILDFFARSSQ